MAKTLEDYLSEITTLAGSRDLSTRWYRDQVRQIVPRNLGEGTVTGMIRRGDNSTRPIYGILNLYAYDPKLKESLRYYDVFPLVIPVQRLPGGFLGINFHYLSIPLRLQLMEKIAPMSAENRILGWNRVSRFRLVKPCVKRYLTRHVQSRFLKIQDEDMPIAAMMPIQRFRKERATTVYAESRRMLG